MSMFDDGASTSDLENDLARHRPAPSDEFVTSLARSVGGGQRTGFARGVGVAVATVGAVLLALGLGGAGYALSKSIHKNTSDVHLNQTGVVNGPNSPAHAQYGPVTVPPFPSNTTPTTTPTTTPSSTGAGTSPASTSSPPPTSTTGAGTAGEATTSSQSGPPPSTSGTAGTTTSGGLPFTGLSLLVPVLVGVGLIGAGIALRRRGRSTSD